MKQIILALSICLLAFSAFAQEKYFTRTGHVVFNSETPSEKISANNYQVTSILNSTTGDLDFSILIKSFEFEKALMQEHFNENYMESDKFPKAIFKGKIKNFDKLTLSKPGVYAIEVEGDMTIHGVTKKMAAKGTIEVKGEELHAKADFPITLKEYNISIPKIAQNKIAETVQVKADLNYLPYSKPKN
jgi:polyisoprenoid-binding protein YceI